MATSDYTIADQTGASFLTDINGQLAAIKSNNSDTETSTNPTNISSTVYEINGFMWYDTTNDLLKVRDQDNTKWITVLLGTIDTAELEDDAVTLAKQANLPANTIQGNNTGSAINPKALTIAETQSLLSIASYSLSGTTLTITT